EQADITDDTGHYRIGGLEPGRYVVRFFYANEKVERQDVSASAGATSTVSVAMSTRPQTGETYTIREKAPMVDVGSTMVGATASENRFVIDGANVASRSFSGSSAPVQTFGLRPPPGYQAPAAALAGGWDLRFPVAGKDTVRSGRAARKVPLLLRTW